MLKREVTFAIIALLGYSCENKLIFMAQQGAVKSPVVLTLSDELSKFG
jgi:hypothetical protein